MGKVCEWYKWGLRINDMRIWVKVSFINELLNTVEISYCGEMCDIMLATNEHSDDLQNMLLNFAEVVTRIGKVYEEEYTERAEYYED
jgi:hypothetical protein